MNELRMYTDTSPLKLYLTVAIPGAISMVASSLWGLFDGIFVGQLLGETAFAALNLAFPFVLINFALADLIGVGSSIPISILLGKKKDKEANNYFTAACLMIVGTGILMGAIFYLAAPLLMRLMGAEGLLEELAIRYIRGYAIFSPTTTIIFAVDNYLRICGKVNGSMLLNIAMSIIILGLEYLFLGVFNMDICGSAYAVSIGMTIAAIIALWPFYRKKLQLRFCRPKFSRSMVKQVFSSGSPIFLSNVAARLTSVVMNMALLQVGGQNAVSVYGILLYAGDSFQQILYGACDSMQPAIGYNYGAGDSKRVRSMEICCLISGAIISAIAVLIMLLLPEQVSSLFIRKGEEGLLAMSAHAMRIFSLTYLTRWFAFSIQSFLIAIDKPLPATILSVLNALIIPMLLLVALRPLGLDGLFMNTPITTALVSLIALLIIIVMNKKGKLIAEEALVDEKYCRESSI